MAPRTNTKILSVPPLLHDGQCCVTFETAGGGKILKDAHVWAILEQMGSEGLFNHRIGTTFMKIPDYVVRCHNGEARGVLVGNVILTAAHCLCNHVDPSVAWGAIAAERIQTRDGVIWTCPLAVEPCADIAVLGPHKHEAFLDDLEAFETFCQNTKPVSVSRHSIKPREKVPVRVLGHDGRWIKGVAEVSTKNSHSLCIKADKEIKGGCSGGPVLNLSDELLAIVSHSSIPRSGIPSTGLYPRPRYALPVWICREF